MKGKLEGLNQCVGSCLKVFLVLLVITCTVFLIIQHDLMQDVYYTYVSGSKEIRNSTKIETINATKSKYFVTSRARLDDIRNTWLEGNRKSLAVFILSAVGYNRTTALGYRHEIKLNGWQAAKHRQVVIKCCVLWCDGRKTEYVSPNRTTRGKRLNLVAIQLTCPVNNSLSDIQGVVLDFAKKKCPTQQSDYLAIFSPRKQPERHSFAICLKILYGNIDNTLLVDWLEFYRAIKVDKVFMFVYNITEETKAIIQFYERLGFLETRNFAFPWKNGRNVGMKTPVVWEDEQVVVYDAFYRLHGYTYMAIIDLDEFLLPRKHGNIKDTMEYLMDTYPKAAGFALKSFIFNKDWGMSGRINGSDVVKYIQRTRALTGAPARAKNILIPSRVRVDSQLFTHSFNPKPGFESYTVNESTLAVNHYRACYTTLKRACDKRKRIIDTSMIKIFDKIHNRTRLTT